jgi:hypothetical protein
LKNPYGVLLEFSNREPLMEAAKAAYASGYRKMDAFTPYPVEGLADAIGFKKDRVPLLTLIGGVSGGILAFAMQWYANSVDYPINIGGRPLLSWPAFIPITFELTVLGASLSAAFGMLALNRLPKLWHPVFNSPKFHRASRDRFFLCILAHDPQYDLDAIRLLSNSAGALSLEEVSSED